MVEQPTTERQAEFVALADRLAGPIAAQAAVHDRDGSFPHAAFQAMHAAGYLALTVPEEYGGRGADPLEVALAQERLAMADGSTALAATMHLILVGRLAETRAWPEPIFARLCRAVVTEGALINSAASEAAMGSPSRGGLPGTTARPDAKGWRLNGRKRWTSLASALRYFVVMATADDEHGVPRRQNFLVEAGAPGLSVVETWDNLAMRATASHDLVLDDVLVPAEHRLPEEGAIATGDGRGWSIVTGAVYIGVAAAARDYAVAYAKHRQPPGMDGPIATLESVQHRVAQMDLKLLSARSVLYATARAWVAEPAKRAELAWRLAAAKYLATNEAIAVTDLALRVVGSAGLDRAEPLERYFRDVRAGLGHPPMDDAALGLIGRTALGI